MSAAAPRIAMVAGETSGDLLAGLLLDGMQALWPQLQAHGIGGAQMQARGFDAWWPSDKLAVHGYSLELVRRLSEIVGIRKQLRRRLLADKPDVFIGVDAPDFNLGLETDLRAAGTKTVHFVCPSIWAWRAERIDRIRRAADHVLCIFPFEPELLERHGIAATYVGHPLADVIPLVPDRAAARRQLGLSPDGQVLAILPGSRRAEVEYISEGFFKAAALVRQALPAIELIVPAVPALYERIAAQAQASGLGNAIKVVSGQSHAVLAACDVTLIASGTATLEAALFKRPMVIAYAMPGFSYRLMAAKRQLPWIGLPNVLCAPRGWLHRPASVAPHDWADRPGAPFVVPELIQHAATPDALARAVLDWLAAPEKIAAVQQRFTALHHELQRDTAQLATDAIETLLAR